MGAESWPVHGRGSGPPGETPQPPAQTNRAYCPTRMKMTRHISPHNQTTVPVLDRNGAPLAPTRPSRARRWLEAGKAVRCRKHGRFAVQLVNHQADDCTVPEMTLGIDPGVRRTGMAVTLQNQEGSKVVAAVEIHHRGGQITQAMTKRRSLRNNRRGRLRRRPARFYNRTRKPGWLQPTLASIQANILTNVKHLRDLFPISRVLIETCKFDPRLMWDPNVEGKEYQESERGRMQVREYVLQRDRRICQYCGTRKGRIEIDHVVPQSKNGSDRVSNLVTSCRRCNQKKDNRSLAEFLKKKPAELKKIEAQLKRSLSSSTHMNYLMHLLRRELKGQGLPIWESDAISTAYTRKVLGVKKTHTNDAACLGCPEKLTNLPEEVTVVRSVGHGRRQMLTPPSEHGTPRYKAGHEGRNSPYRAYCRLAREVQGFTTMPGHKLRQRRTGGITSGDLIQYTHPVLGAVTGSAGVTNSKGKTRAGVSGMRNMKIGAVTLLGRNNGYRYERGPNETPKRN